LPFIFFIKQYIIFADQVVAFPGENGTAAMVSRARKAGFGIVVWER
jgi:hypothetical protein